MLGLWLQWQLELVLATSSGVESPVSEPCLAIEKDQVDYHNNEYNELITRDYSYGDYNFYGDSFSIVHSINAYLSASVVPVAHI